KKVIDLREGQQVKLTICRFATNGILAIIDDKYAGILYENETYEKLKIGDIVTGYVKKIREDKKIDLTLRRSIRDAIEDAKDKIMNMLIENNGTLDLNDKSSPEAIKEKLQMSKLTFKKALGGLYKERRIVMGDKSISMIPER
ncbi:MAG TPA: GntR family transcriptional regulator, partial [Candidatus Wallbacteria bacterium]|nr:GntR family transcriptional regulator [Candidatus Wallbacteria bacterium]